MVEDGKRWRCGAKKGREWEREEYDGIGEVGCSMEYQRCGISVCEDLRVSLCVSLCASIVVLWVLMSYARSVRCKMRRSTASASN